MNNPLVLLAMFSLAQAIKHGDTEDILPADFSSLSDDIDLYLMPKVKDQAHTVVDVAIQVLRDAVAAEKENLKTQKSVPDNNLMLAMTVVGDNLRNGGLELTPEIEEVIENSKKYLVPQFDHVGDIEALSEFTAQYAVQSLKDGIEKAKQNENS